MLPCTKKMSHAFAPSGDTVGVGGFLSFLDKNAREDSGGGCNDDEVMVT